MRRLPPLLASHALTLMGLAMLAAAAWWLRDDPQALGPMLGAFALLAVNLAAALITRPRLRREPGLLVLHLALLALLLLAGGGRLARYEAQVELADGQALADAVPAILVRGPWHSAAMAGVDFIQGPFTVDYGPGLRRGDTRSQVRVAGETRWVGDTAPLVLDGYRFTTTHNKGYAALLAWIPERGEVIRGAVNMPGYPLFEGHQENRFQPPGGAVLDLALVLDRSPPLDQAWRLDSRQAAGWLRLRRAGVEYRLAPGDSLALPGGRLVLEGWRGWMGYRVFHDPTLPWLFACACLAVGGLFWHLLSAGTRPAGRSAETPEAAHAV